MSAPQKPDYATVAETLGQFGIQASESLSKSVRIYLTLLQDWNEKMNLTRIRDDIGVLRDHFAESFFAADFLERTDGPILDVGSGAGFPGMAIKLRRPELKVYLVEGRKKKTAFLTAVKRELGLVSVSILNKLLQECSSEDFGEAPGTLTMRSVGDMNRLVELGGRLCRPASNVLLLTTMSRLEGLIKESASVLWKEPVFLPWARDRVVLFGRREL